MKERLSSLCLTSLTLGFVVKPGRNVAQFFALYFVVRSLVLNVLTVVNICQSTATRIIKFVIVLKPQYKNFTPYYCRIFTTPELVVE